MVKSFQTNSLTKITNPNLSIRISLDQGLFFAALLIYLLTRLIGLDQFPIYFFSDEAVNTILAEDFIRDDFSDYEGQRWPTFFKNYDKYNLSTSVYLQVLPAYFFERSVWVTRGTSALVSILGAVFTALMLRQIFRMPAWWSGVFFLSITPAWFLHSRTAFETTLFTTLYAGFLYFYLRYRCGTPRAIYAAVLLGALAFYTYSPGRIILPVSAFIFGITDLRYHWRQRKKLVFAATFLVLCMLPFFRFLNTHPEANFDQLYRQSSYWFADLSLAQKFLRFGAEYLQGLNPLYWYFPGEQDLMRHRFGGLGHLFLPSLPFLLLGLFLTLTRMHKPENRILILALLAIPSGAALIDIGITRVLVMVIPAAVLQGLGFGWLVAWLEKRCLSYPKIAWLAFLIFSGINLWLLRNALDRGPLWYQDYGLHGMQWGSRQVFSKIKQLQEENRDLKIVLSPTWTNGTDVLARFFMPVDPPPVELSSIDPYIVDVHPELDKTLFVLPEYEYDQLSESTIFSTIEVQQILEYPNKQPGFYFLHLGYAEDVQAQLAAERAARRLPEHTRVWIDGQQVEAKHSPLDIGELQLAFDGDPRSLCRTQAANPAEIHLNFPAPKRIHGISLIIGSTEVEVNLTAAISEQQISEFIFQSKGTVSQPEVSYQFPEVLPVQKLTILIRDVTQGEPGNVHFWEIRFLED